MNGEMFAINGPLYHPLKLAHILAGSVALFAAPVALAVAKGSRAHRRAGWVYVAAMGMVAATALLLAWIKPNPFLTLVAVFSFYLAASGVRMLRLKHKTPELRVAQIVDFALSGAMMFAALGLVAMALLGLRQGNTFAYVALVFGGLALALVGDEFRARKRAETDRKQWLSQHIRRMIAAYIATVTAFSAVNFGRWFSLPPLVVWLWPTVIGTVAIFYFIGRYTRGKKPEAVHARLE